MEMIHGHLPGSMTAPQKEIFPVTGSDNKVQSSHKPAINPILSYFNPAHIFLFISLFIYLYPYKTIKFFI
jgi:hypothetical protein